jgi:hypothetical protein
MIRASNLRKWYRREVAASEIRGRAVRGCGRRLGILGAEYRPQATLVHDADSHIDAFRPACTGPTNLV